MISNYESIFNLRGNSYNQAMEMYPLARELEFIQATSAVSLDRGMSVADVPAGGGYLRSFMPEGTVFLEHEACNFHGNVSPNDIQSSLFPFSWGNNLVDVLISLAGIYHLENKLPFFKEAFRVLKTGGKMVLSDVKDGSHCAKFLDDFVGKFNSTGHDGIYINQETEKLIMKAGFSVENISENNFHWKFDSEFHMADFCSKLFDLRNTPIEIIVENIHKYLGFEKLPNGSIGMKWQLLTITAKK